MKAETKSKPKPIKNTVPITKPDGRPKVKLGTGRHLAFMSDTLFDEDLKQ
ncbi:hypothetical protein [Spirosoma fluminis]